MARPSELIEDLETLIDIRQPAILYGPPGVGKSELVVGIAKKRGVELIDFRTALREPTDIRGFPMPDQASKTMKFFRDAELPTKGEGILFMDELLSAPPAVQAAAMQLTLPPFRIGDYQLPKGWAILAASNRESDRGVVHRMISTLANRFAHFDFDVHVDDWVAWALTHDVSAEDIAFIRFRSQLLHKFDPKSNERAFPTPRTWVKSFNARAKARNEASAVRLVQSLVGSGPTAEYFAFLKTINELPSYAEIKKHPTKTKVPTSPGVLYAVVTMLGSNVNNDADLSAVMPYADRLPKEYQVVFMRDCLVRVPALRTSKTFIKWGMENEELIV